MAHYLADAFIHQTGPMDVEIWCEPFAGGAGAGLALLEADTVCEVWLTEKNPALAALWRCMVDDGQRLAARVATTVPDMSLWLESREILTAVGAGNHGLDDLTVGMAAFIVNRCSRSGIVTASSGPIGGKTQTGQWLLGSRFNGPELAERILRLHAWGRVGRLKVEEGDAVERIADLNDSGLGDEVMLLVDPVYIGMGNRLYEHGMTAADHQLLADTLNGCWSPWILTYDNHPMVADMYPECRIVPYAIPTTANKARITTELLVFADNVRVPDSLVPVSSARLERAS
jgi:DNA adenine methylase